MQNNIQGNPQVLIYVLSSTHLSDIPFPYVNWKERNDTDLTKYVNLFIIIKKQLADKLVYFNAEEKKITQFYEIIRGRGEILSEKSLCLTHLPRLYMSSTFCRINT